jgi:hypothetical protein
MNTQHSTLKSPLLTTRRILLALACIATVGAANSQSTNLVENGDFKNDLSGWKVYSHLPSKKPEASVVDDPVAGSSALQVVIPDVADLKKYQVGFSQPIPAEFGASDSITLRFTARSLESLKIAGMVHTVTEPHRNKFYKQFDLTPEWATYEFTEKKPEAFANGEAQVEFFLSFGPGQVEITNIEVLSAK